MKRQNLVASGQRTFKITRVHARTPLLSLVFGNARVLEGTNEPIVISDDIDDPKAAQRTLDAVDAAHRQCLIANSIKAEVTIQPDIELSVSE